MGDFSVADTSLPDRVNTLEKETHVLLFRMDQYDLHRLPDRLTSVEAAVRSLDEKLDDIHTSMERMNGNLNAVRSEINADIEQMESLLQGQIGSIRSSLDQLYGRIAGIVAVLTSLGICVSFVVEHWSIVTKIMGN